MKRTTLVIFAVTGALACGGSQKTDEPDTVQMKETAVDDIEPASVQKPPPKKPDRPPPASQELAVQMFEVAPDVPAKTEDGLMIQMNSGAPDWSFAFVHSGETQQVAYSGEPLYIEGVAFGRLFVISRLGETVQVTLRSDAPAQPLSESAATEIAKEEQQSRLGCDGEPRVTTPPNGTLVLEVPAAENASGCRIVIGRYTGEVVDL